MYTTILPVSTEETSGVRRDPDAGVCGPGTNDRRPGSICSVRGRGAGRPARCRAARKEGPAGTRNLPAPGRDRITDILKFPHAPGKTRATADPAAEGFRPGAPAHVTA